MKSENSKLLRFSILSLILVSSAVAWATGVHETVLYTFPEDGSAGNLPEGALVADKAGNLYGTTLFGGINCIIGCGIVFELTPPPEQGSVWTETVLYEFQGGSDGEGPQCTLVIDSNGNLYGTSSGFSTGVVVWELSPPPQPGGTWTENTLYTFQDLAFGPETSSGSLLMDRNGNLYGTTWWGGIQNGNCLASGCGTVFEVSPPQQTGGAWTGAVLYAFQGGSDSSAPVGSLIIDSKGALYGTTGGNGACPPECGTVFQLLPPLQPGVSWTENVLYAFNGPDGYGAYAGLVSDRKGNLYSTTAYGGPLLCAGGKQGCGNVFELSPPPVQGGAWTETVLHNFGGLKSGDGEHPYSNLIMDSHRDLYGTTAEGGTLDVGTVFELLPPTQPGGSWTERRFALSTNGNAAPPLAGLMFGPGTAVSGTGTGSFNGGGVFSISP